MTRGNNILKRIDLNLGRFLVKAAWCVILSVAMGCILMISVYLLPTDRIRDNIAETSEMLEREGVYYQWAEGYKNAQSDNYSDASLYLNAMYPGSGNVVKDAMNNPRRLYGDDNNEESAVIMANGRDEGKQSHDVNYGRYWHGSLVFLKPLLLAFDISDIRFFSVIIHFGLLFLIVAGFVKRKITDALPGFFMAIIMLNPISMVMCYCYSVEYTMTLAGAVLILYFHEFFRKGQNYFYYFLFSGICTVYFNELCFPMVVFGVSMILYLLLSEEKGWILVKKQLLLGICWGAGYVLMWMGKWICAWALTGFNYFAEALGQVLRYTSDHATWEIENPAVSDRLAKNMNVYAKWPFAFLILLVGVLTAVCFWRKKQAGNKMSVNRMLPYFLMVVFPFSVYIVLGNGYAYVHYWFTHRLLVVSVFAGTSMILQSMESA